MKKIIKKLEDIHEEIMEKHGALEDIFEEKSENWQDGERGEAFQEKMDKLEEAADDLQMSIDELEEFQEL